jgi:hypothetical protein
VEKVLAPVQKIPPDKILALHVVNSCRKQKSEAARKPIFRNTRQESYQSVDQRNT